MDSTSHRLAKRRSTTGPSRTDRTVGLGLTGLQIGPDGLPVASGGERRFVVVRKAVPLGWVIALTALAVCLAPAPASSARSGSRLALTSFEIGIVSELNAVRVAHGLTPLRVNRALTAAAAAHCTEMIADGYFDHNSASGATFRTRIGRWYRSAGFTYWAVGENLLWSTGKLDPGYTVEMWMRSAEHRENLLSSRWRDIGIGVASSPDVPGVYGDHAVTLVATEFGVRR